MSKKISLIVSIAGDNNVIGDGRRIPWHYKVDRENSDTLTASHTVVMGRRTWESSPFPITGRLNIILSRTMWSVPEGALIARSVDDVVGMASGDIFIIGGGKVFESFLPIASKIHVTWVPMNIPEGIKFPEIDRRIWHPNTRWVSDNLVFEIFDRVL